MAHEAQGRPKHRTLQRHRLLHAHPDSVTDSLFADNAFFDPHDLLQVKYEMLRRVRVDHEPVATVARAFGFSRQAFYQAQAAFNREGLAGLLPDKPGPRRAHKLSDHVVQFVQQQRAADINLSWPQLAAQVHRRFGRN
jgi:hypothetical protein